MDRPTKRLKSEHPLYTTLPQFPYVLVELILQYNALRIYVVGIGGENPGEQWSEFTGWKPLPALEESLSSWSGESTLHSADSFLSFHIGTHQWKIGPQTDRNRVHATINMIQSNWCITGGFIERMGSVDTVNAYSAHMSPRQWVLLPSMKQGRSKHACVVMNDAILYVLGGYGLTSSCSSGYAKRDIESVERYDWWRQQWSEAPSLPIPCNHHAAACNDHDIYVLGGIHDSSHLSQCIVLKAGQKKWETLPPLPYPMYGMGIAVYGSTDLFVVDRTYVHRLDLITLRWHQDLPPLQHSRFRCGVAVV